MHSPYYNESHLKIKLAIRKWINEKVKFTKFRFYLMLMIGMLTGLILSGIHPRMMEEAQSKRGSLRRRPNLESGRLLVNAQDHNLRAVSPDLLKELNMSSGLLQSMRQEQASQVNHQIRSLQRQDLLILGLT